MSNEACSKGADETGYCCASTGPEAMPQARETIGYRTKCCYEILTSIAASLLLTTGESGA